ncbi:MAG: flagellar hook-basal body complex protein [Phycisphaera sp.]|nr:flagellar hook-basal body complex protein [Phycisphaera sp.]
MNYGLFLSASGVLSNMYRQDALANNLANAQTIGFKRDLASLSQRDPESVEGGFGFDLRNDLLDRLGGGVLAGPQRISFEQGHLEQTGNDLDLAIDGKNAFFAVRSTDPRTGRHDIQLTRDGRFALSSDGTLVTQDGKPVLDTSDQPIRLQRGATIDIDETGRIRQNGEESARIQVTAVSQPGALTKLGGGLLGWNSTRDIRTDPQNATVKQRFVEASNVDPIQTMMKIVDATKAATANGNLIRYHDLLLDRAVNTLGRVNA